MLTPLPFFFLSLLWEHIKTRKLTRSLLGIIHILRRHLGQTQEFSACMCLPTSFLHVPFLAPHSYPLSPVHILVTYAF